MGDCCGDGGAIAGVCGCSSAGTKLEHGMTADSCCSKKAVDGICSCLEEGTPLTDDISIKACCGEVAEHGVCGCFPEKYRLLEGHARAWCTPSGETPAQLDRTMCCSQILVNDTCHDCIGPHDPPL